MARSNKFLNQVKGYSAGNDFTKKQTNATTELVKRLDKNESNETISQELIKDTIETDEIIKENTPESIELTTSTEDLINDKKGVDEVAPQKTVTEKKTKVSKINKYDFSNEEYIKTTISIDAILFNTFKYIAKTNKTTITEYLIELLVEDKNEKAKNPTVIDFTKRIENKKLKNPYQRHYIGLPESLMDYVRREAFKTQTTVSGYITKIIEAECETKKDLYI